MLLMLLITAISEFATISVPPAKVRSTYAIECAHGSYKFEIVQRSESQPVSDDREISSQSVELARFKRSSAPVSRELKAKMEGVFEQFESISYVSVSCGNPDAFFLRIDLGGPHRDSGDAYDSCRSKKLSFDWETRRTILIYEGKVAVEGDEIGRCNDPKRLATRGMSYDHEP